MTPRIVCPDCSKRMASQRFERHVWFMHLKIATLAGGGFWVKSSMGSFTQFVPYEQEESHHA